MDKLLMFRGFTGGSWRISSAIYGVYALVFSASWPSFCLASYFAGSGLAILYIYLGAGALIT